MAAINGFDEDPKNDRVRPPPAWSHLTDSVDGVSALPKLVDPGSDLSGAEIKDILAAANLFSGLLTGGRVGIPLGAVGKAAGFYEDVQDGKKEEPENGLEWAIGLSRGR